MVFNIDKSDDDRSRENGMVVMAEIGVTASSSSSNVGNGNSDEVDIIVINAANDTLDVLKSYFSTHWQGITWFDCDSCRDDVKFSSVHLKVNFLLKFLNF